MEDSNRSNAMARQSLEATVNRLWLLIRAGYPVIYIVSHEESRVQNYLIKIFRAIQASENPRKNFLRWQEGIGLQQLKRWNPDADLAQPSAGGDPENRWLHARGLETGHSWEPPVLNEAIEVMHSMRSAGVEVTNDDLSDCLVVFSDVHRRLEDRAFNSLVRPVRNAASDFRLYYDRQRESHNNAEGRRHRYKTIVIVAPTVINLSSELERDLLVVDFPLPEKAELLLELNRLIEAKVLKLPDETPPEELKSLFDQDRKEVLPFEYRQRLCDLIAGAGRGLTLDDFRFGLNQMAVENQMLSSKQIDRMLDLKAKTIKSQAIQYTPNVKVNLGGLDEVKHWIDVRRGAAVSDQVRKDYHLKAPKGVLLCGPAGGGKSKLAQMIASRCNLALLRLDIGALFGSYVGESEQRTRDALKLAEVLAPVVLWLDEIDKAFTGIGSGDGGVSARVFGHFLTWLAEKEDSVFVAATANDFNKLLVPFPEFGRKGRFDETFWVGLPDEDARKEIFEIYLEPLKKDKYLQEASSDEIRALARQVQLASSTLPNVDPFVQLCWLLSRDALSQALTGAEIEYAITEATYQAYDLDQRSGSRQLRDQLTPKLIFEMVQQAKEHALYKPGLPPAKDLQALQQFAANKHWIGAR
jgi:hypothetical protein